MISGIYDAEMMRTIANYGMENNVICLVFSGNDNDGYSYIAGSNSLDMKAVAKTINSALNGRGGGRDTMIQGKVSASEDDIISFIKNTY